MSININSKSSLVIAGSAALAGLVICGITKGIGWAKDKKSGKKAEEEPAEEKTEVKEDSEE